MLCAMSNRPWLANYDSDVPHSLEPYPDKTLVDFLDDLATKHGDRTALLFKGSSVSYRQLSAASTAFAAALIGLGVRPGDRVALLLPNCPQFMPLQTAFAKNHALQCGFCTPGFLMSAIHLLSENPDPDDAAIRKGLGGNTCRCTGYVNIIAAVKDAAEQMRSLRS